MASRKEQKEQARAARLAAEQAAAANRARMRRMQMLGGVILGAIAIVAVAVAISSGSTSSENHIVTTSTAEKPIDTLVDSLLAGIPQTGTVLGNPKAPVTMTYFGDLECPICRDFTVGDDGGGFGQFVSTLVKQGKVKVDYRSFCTATCNGPGQSTFNTQQVAAYAAGAQDKFWYFAELFYHEQGEEDTGYVNEKYLDGLADQIPGLNLTKWQSDRGNPSYLSQVQGDESAGSSDGVQGTPTVIMNGPKGSEPLPSGIPTYSELTSAVKSVT
jgi:protein-disulfide isomerase